MSCTFVLVHGAWHGGWCWRLVAERLRAAGHAVFTPTLTGLGQSRHHLSGVISLDVLVADVANLIEAEELEDVVLVGHSFGGTVAAGVADRMPERLRHLVVLDALLCESGQSPFDTLAPEVAAARRRLVREQGSGVALPPPSLATLGIPEDHPLAAWVLRRLTPHPARSYESPLVLAHPLGNGLPCSYIQCTAPVFASLEGSRRLARRQSGWRYSEIATGHDAMVTAPDELSRLLMEIAQSSSQTRRSTMRLTP